MPIPRLAPSSSSPRGGKGPNGMGRRCGWPVRRLSRGGRCRPGMNGSGDAVAVEISEPSLDDVFFALTGNSAGRDRTGTGAGEGCRMTTTADVRPRPGWALIAIADTIDVAGGTSPMLRMPQALVFALVQPVLFVLLFRYTFGGAIHVPGVPYADYLMPGIFAQSVAFGALGTAVGLAITCAAACSSATARCRCRGRRCCAGRAIADLARNLAVVAVMAGVGFAVGFRVHTSAVAFLAALGLVALFGYALSWAFVSLGLRSAIPRPPRPPACR